MSWLQTFLIVLVALVWATVSAYVVLKDINAAPAIIGLMTPPLMFVLGAALGVNLRKVGEALRNGGSGE